MWGPVAAGESVGDVMSEDRCVTELQSAASLVAGCGAVGAVRERYSTGWFCGPSSVPSVSHLNRLLLCRSCDASECSPEISNGI